MERNTKTRACTGYQNARCVGLEAAVAQLTLQKIVLAGADAPAVLGYLGQAHDTVTKYRAVKFWVVQRHRSSVRRIAKLRVVVRDSALTLERDRNLAGLVCPLLPARDPHNQMSRTATRSGSSPQSLGVHLIPLLHEIPERRHPARWEGSEQMNEAARTGGGCLHRDLFNEWKICVGEFCGKCPILCAVGEKETMIIVK